MELKTAIDELFKLFESGKKAIDMRYSIVNKKLVLESISIHEVYVWDGKEEPVYFTYNHENKIMNVSNFTASDLKDETLMSFLGLPTGDVV